MKNFLEKYRFYIAGFLVLVILIGVGVLLWQKNTSKQIAKSGIRVDIAGAVKNPGLYSLKSGAILQDLFNQAGNLTSNADLTQVAKQFNRAEILKDGEKIYIPAIGEASSNQTGQVAGTTTTASSASSQQVTGKVNLNSATAEELDTLPGIGPAYAQKIIDYRNTNGGFGAIEEIMEVKGIGQKTFDKLKDLITI
jgi:competence protein ComEA